MINLKAHNISKTSIGITDIYASYFYCYAPSFKFKGETHDCYELILCNSGEIIVISENTEYILKSGQAFLHKKMEYHSVYSNNTFSSTAIILFGAHGDKLNLIFDKVLDCNDKEKSLINILVTESCKFLKGDNQSTYLPNNKDEFASSQFIKNYLEILLIMLIRAQESQNSFSFEKKETVLVNQILEYLNNNINEKVNLTELAFKLGYSVSYITKQFKKNYGTSIIEYFIKLKIKSATEMILNGEHTIKNISDKLGFDSVQYFYRQFKKILKMTPSDYIKSIKMNDFIDLTKVLY